MTPIEALNSAMRAGAELLGIADDVGTIEQGKLADIIAVNGNPLKDIRRMEHISLILKDGQLYHR